MGRVYTPEQVTRHDVPEKGAHEKAGQYILDELFEPLLPAGDDELKLFEPDGTGVDSAMVYGSTAYGTAGVRSDLDILVFYRPSQAHTALSSIASILNKAGKEFKVPIEQNILPTGAVFSDREHGLDPLFAGHLIEIHNTYNGRWCRNNPTSGLDRVADQASDPYAVNRLAHGYVGGRRNYFAKALTGDMSEVDFNVFQRALELPSAVGRKAVAATMEDGDDPLDMSSRGSMQERAKRALLTHSQNWQPDLLREHDGLYALDQEYSLVLDDTLNGYMGSENYSKWIAQHYGEVCRMAYTLSEAWVTIFRARQQHLIPKQTLVASEGFSGFELQVLPSNDDYPNASYS